jgi:phosphoadenosine phosphosulfate reductase
VSVIPSLSELRQASAELGGVELIRTLAGPGGPLRHRTALVSSFGAESVVLLHMAAQVDQALPVIFLDTGRHFP